jgi:hypothetical protein
MLNECSASYALTRPGSGASSRRSTGKDFDSTSLLCIVLAGDARLPERLRTHELFPLGTRIRRRLHLETASREQLCAASTICSTRPEPRADEATRAPGPEVIVAEVWCGVTTENRDAPTGDARAWRPAG